MTFLLFIINTLRILLHNVYKTISSFIKCYHFIYSKKFKIWRQSQRNFTDNVCCLRHLLLKTEHQCNLVDDLSNYKMFCFKQLKRCICIHNTIPVSYTHLDVYKRQLQHHTFSVKFLCA